MISWFDFRHQHNDQVFSALNNILFSDGAYIHIASSTRLDRPLEIIYLDSNLSQSAQFDGSMIQTRNIIILEEGAQATLIERFISSQADRDNEKYFHNHVSEIYLDDNAELKHDRLQEESRAAWHLSSLYVTLQKHSRYMSTSAALGGRWARTEYKVNFKAQQAECDLSGFYAAGNEQLVDFHLDVQHHVPECRSREQFKGVVYGKGRAVFDGRILVASQAQHSDAALTNDNLLLSDDGEVDTKPQLEIYADDVKCSHGTTVGRLDPQQLFYLRSRGIAEDAARKILCQGFAAEILERFTCPALRNDVTEKLLQALNKITVSTEAHHEH